MMPNSSVAAPLALLFLTAAGSMAAAGAEEVTAGPVLGKTTVPPLSLTRPGERSTPLSTSAAASGTVPFSKPNCTFYFGSDVDDDSLQITVVDPDVAAGYPLGDKTFMHHTGPGSACISPGPPAGCHRYFKITYSGCEVIANGSLVDAAGHLDTSGLFDRDTGVLKSCIESVFKEEVFCYGAPVDHPQSCECPGNSFTASIASTTSTLSAALSDSPTTSSASTVRRLSQPSSSRPLPHTSSAPTTIPAAAATTTTTSSTTLMSSTTTGAAITTTTDSSNFTVGTTTTTTPHSSTASITSGRPTTDTTSMVDQPPSTSTGAERTTTLVLTTTGQQLPCESREDIFNLPIVTCTVTIDNALDGIWVDGEDILDYASDPACFDDWQEACTFTFFDRSFSGPQLLAFWGDERTFVGNAGEYCAQSGAGAALVCESTNQESEWNFVQTDFSWATLSSQDVLTDTEPAWYSPSFDDSAWKPPSTAASGFFCDACENIALHSASGRPVLQVWGAECSDNAFFRKRIPMSCPGTEHTWPYFPPTTGTTTGPSGDAVTDSVVEADPAPSVVTDDVTCDDSEDADPEDACPDTLGIYIAIGTAAFAVVFAVVVAISYGQFVKKLRRGAAQTAASPAPRTLTALDTVVESLSGADPDPGPNQPATESESFLSI